jgi:hypothetical protein
MSQPLTVLLSDAAYQALQRRAQAIGKSPAECAANAIESQFQTDSPATSEIDLGNARERFERHFGALRLGDRFSADNDRIDEDLAREYDPTRRAD